MNKKWFLILFIALIFSGGRIAAAEGGSHMDMSGDHSNGQNMEGMDMSGEDSEGHDMEGMDKSGDNSNGHDMEGMDMSGDHSDGHDMEGMDMSGDHSDGHDMEGMDMSGDHSDSHDHGAKDKNGHDDMEGMNMEGGGHSHGPVKETPPNLKVLGTFGAVNLSFIVLGIWNKWFRRKGDSNGDSK